MSKFLFVFLVVCDLLVPAVMVGIGAVWGKRPPKKISHLYEYRTTMSMKNQGTWDFANSYCAGIFLKWGVAMAAVTAAAIALFKERLAAVSLVITLVQCAALCLTIIPTELALRRSFTEQGKRKKHSQEWN
jgi:hypothetical protein